MQTDFDFAQSDRHPERSRRVFIVQKSLISFFIKQF